MDSIFMEKRKNHRWVALTALVLFMGAGCLPMHSQTPAQGIKGTVLWLEGNFMPGPGQDRKGQPVERALYIYQILKESDLKKKEPFYAIPDLEPVKIVTSDSEGRFSVALPPGSYSLLSKEKEGLYANSFDGEGHINPVHVKAGHYTEITIKIDYKAAF
jgi:hypothetical protein